MGTFSMRGSAGLPVDQGREQNMPKPVQADVVEVVIGEVQLEPAPEILDPPLEFIPAQGGDRRYELFELSLRAHGFGPAKYVVIIRNIQVAPGLSPPRRQSLRENSLRSS